MNRILGTAMLAVLAGLTVVSPIAVLPASAQSAVTEQTVTFTIENMTCALCPVTVKRAMEGVEGVRAAEIDFEARTATVIFDNVTTRAASIAAASANAGYPARVEE